MCLGGRCSAGRKGEQGGAIQLQDNYAQDPGYQKRRKMLQAGGGRPQVFLRQTLQGARVGVTLGHSLNVGSLIAFFLCPAVPNADWDRGRWQGQQQGRF